MRSTSKLIVAAAAVTIVLGGFAVLKGLDSSDKPVITVYKSPTCGCCKKWVTHLEENGFEVKPVDTNEVSMMKAKYGVPGDLISCHTGLVNGYVVEGHVPAEEIKKMLKEKPEIAGLAVPGMPMGSPGMEGGRVDHYDIVAFQKDGKRSVYASR